MDPMSDPSIEIAERVLAVPGVAGLHAGMFGEVATYLPGRRVVGVRLTDTCVDVHVSLLVDAPVRETAAAIQRSVGRITDLPVDVTIEDILPERLPDPQFDAC